MTLRSLINFGEAMTYSAGINIKILDTDMYEFSFCILKKDKDLVALIKYETDLTSWPVLEERLRKELPINSRIHLNLEGKGILAKTIETKNESFNRSELVKRLFPMIRVDEFLVQHFRTNNIIYFSAVRNDLINHFKSLTYNYTISSFTLGPFIAIPLARILSADKICLENYIITFSNEIVTEISEQKIRDVSDVRVGGEILPVKAILAYASAWYVLIDFQEIILSKLEWIDNSTKKNTFYRALYRSSRVALFVILGVLLTNTFIFYWLQSETEAMVFQESMYSGKKNESEVHYKKISSLTAAHDIIGWKSNQLPVYYADQIALKVTSSIQLTSLEIGVLNGETLRKEKRLAYKNKLIKLKGFTDTPIGLRQWIDSLETLDWVEDVLDQKYQFDARQGKGVFELYVKIK